MFDDEWLLSYYQLNFELVYEKKFCTPTELDNLMPFERDIYIDMITEREKEKKKSLES